MAKKSITSYTSKFKKRSVINPLKTPSSDQFNLVYFLKSTNVELKYLVFLKRFLKKIRHGTPKGIRKYVSSLLIVIRKNYSFTKKSKNSRMGKGKGAYTRSVIKVRKNKVLFYYEGVFKWSIGKVISNFSKKTQVPLGKIEFTNDRCLRGIGTFNHPYIYYTSRRLK